MWMYMHTVTQSHSLSDCRREAQAEVGPCTTERTLDGRTPSIESLRTMGHICVKGCMIITTTSRLSRATWKPFLRLCTSILHHHAPSSVIRRRSSASSIKEARFRSVPYSQPSPPPQVAGVDRCRGAPSHPSQRKRQTHISKSLSPRVLRSLALSPGLSSFSAL